ncbi:hypothetical protein NEOKW01_1854 [Nematocida sp. AWRm80]|nr:hypothetical protein NEOKW01_1854 [Nematocida sp. AWRm80]
MLWEEIEELIRLSLDPQQRKSAEGLALRMDGMPAEARALIEQIKRNTGTAQTMGAIFLKRSLTIGIKDKRVGVEEAQRLSREIVELSFVVPSKVHLLFCECISLLSVLIDSQEIKEIIDRIDLSVPEYTDKEVRALQLIGAYAIKYRTALRSDKLYLDIIECVKEVGPRIVQLSEGLLSGKRAPEQLYTALFNLFISLITQDLPDYLEQNILVVSRCAMECANWESSENILVMLETLTLLSTRFIDAFEEPEILLQNALQMLGKTDEIEESVQVAYLVYFTGLIRNPNLHRFTYENIFQILSLLLSKVENVADIDEPLEFTRTIFTSDMNILRDIACETIKDLVVSNNEILQCILSDRVHKSASSLFYLVSSLFRCLQIRNQDAFTPIVTQAQKVLLSSGTSLTEQESITLHHAAGLLVNGLINERIPQSVVQVDLIMHLIKIFIHSKEYKYLQYILARLIHLGCLTIPSRTLKIEESVCDTIISTLLDSPPNEFLAPMLYSVLRITDIPIDKYIDASGKKLIETIESSGSLLEAKAFWDILSLGVLSGNAQHIENGFAIAKECLIKDITEWFGYALQYCGLCVLFSSNPMHFSVLKMLISHQDMWKHTDIHDSLAYAWCAIALAREHSPVKHQLDTPEQIDSILSMLLHHLIKDNNRSVYIFSRYLPVSLVIPIIIAHSQMLSYLEMPMASIIYTGYARVYSESMVGSLPSEFKSLLSTIIQAIILNPVIPEAYTDVFIQFFTKVQTDSSIDLSMHLSRIQLILSKLKSRNIILREDVSKLSIIDSVFSQALSQGNLK